MIAGGTIEMLLNRIAESVFGRSFPQRPARREGGLETRSYVGAARGH
jgi:hypothetical protein